MAKNLISILGLLAFMGCASHDLQKNQTPIPQEENTNHLIYRISLDHVKDSETLRRKISNIADSYSAKDSVVTDGKGNVAEVIYYDALAPMMRVVETTMDSAYEKRKDGE